MSEKSREIAELRHQIRYLTQLIEDLEQALPQPSLIPPHPVDEAPSSRHDAIKYGPTATGRRGLLKAAGVAATLGVAALASAKAPVARAATGDPVLLGETNTGSGTTMIVPMMDSHPDNLLSIEDPDNTGTNGISSHVGSGWAIAAGGSSGDLYASGSGRIRQALASFVGAPEGGSYTRGEMIRDALGSMYVCFESGQPGSWLKVATHDPNFVGGSISLYNPPFRVYDSRTHDGPLIGNSFRNIFFGHVAGMVGNLTVTNTTSSGYLVISPSEAPAPGTSTVNYLKGQTNANSFIVAVGVNGYVRVHNFGGGNADFVLDATGFIDSE